MNEWWMDRWINGWMDVEIKEGTSLRPKSPLSKLKARVHPPKCFVLLIDLTLTYFKRLISSQYKTRRFHM